jgi:hypothetical protein
MGESNNRTRLRSSNLWELPVMPEGVCGGTITDGEGSTGGSDNGSALLPPEIGVEVSHSSLVTTGSEMTESGFLCGDGNQS